MKPRSTLRFSPGAAGPVLGRRAEVIIPLLPVAHRQPVTDWRDRGLCAEADPDFWFPPEKTSPMGAQRECCRCPVMTECLEYALTNPGKAEYGVWGGLSERERRLLQDRPAPAVIDPLPVTALAQKRCSRCNETKPATGFHRHQGKKDGLSTWCRTCAQDYKREQKVEAAA